KKDDNYQAQVTRIVAGFNNPVDAEMIRNKIYVLEYGGTQGIWEISMPMATVLEIQRPSSQAVLLTVSGSAGDRFAVEASGNLVDWSSLGTLTNSTGTAQFTDPIPLLS